MSAQPKPTTDLEVRITQYLSAGGLFNPELMEHEKVRDLLMDCRKALCQPKPRKQDAATPTGEWTAESLWELMGQAAIDNRSLVKVADAHNAALAADREKTRIAEDTMAWHCSEAGSLRKQLAAEREKLDLADRDRCRLSEGWTLVEQQLAAEQERYDELQRSVMDLSHPNCKGLLNERNDARQQLAAEREKLEDSQTAGATLMRHNEQLRQEKITLVDALTWYADESIYPLVATGHLKAQNALAKLEPRSTRVKEGQK